MDTATPSLSFTDLSKATKLKYLTFRCRRPYIRWIISTLQTVESQNLHQITIHPYTGALRNQTNETVRQEWQDLDQLLVQFWASHSIRPRFVYSLDDGGRNMRYRAPSMLPELTNGGLVDLVEQSSPS